MITITKKMSLGFLGGDYTDSYLTFRSVSLKEFESLQAKAKKVSDDGTKSLAFATDEVVSRFIAGEVAQDGKLVPVSVDDLPDLPAEVFVKAFVELTGTADPKA